MITIDLFGDPVPQGRPRVVRNGNKIHAYDPKEELKQGFKWQIKSQFKGEALTAPLCIDLIFFMPIPKSTTALKKRQMINGLIAHTKKPDLDNLVKFAFDCLNGIAFNDDSQISEMRCKKIYGEKPGTLIRIIPLADEKRELLYENCSR